MTNESLNKKVLVLFCGLAGVGKRTLIDALRKSIPNSAKFEKDLLSDSILGGLDHTTPEYNAIKDRIYKTLATLAIDNLDNGNTVAILQAYYGDKLTKPGTVEYVTSDAYEVKIVYVHCSATKQLQRLTERALARDGDKLGLDSKGNDKFAPYRLAHIKNHLRELSQVSDCLIVDTEDDASLEVNTAKIIDYINAPTARIEINPIANKDALDTVTLNEAFGDYAEFVELLNRIRAVNAPVFTPSFCFTTENAAASVFEQLTSSSSVVCSPRPGR